LGLTFALEILFGDPISCRRARLPIGHEVTALLERVERISDLALASYAEIRAKALDGRPCLAAIVGAHVLADENVSDAQRELGKFGVKADTKHKVQFRRSERRPVERCHRAALPAMKASSDATSVPCAPLASSRHRPVSRLIFSAGHARVSAARDRDSVATSGKFAEGLLASRGSRPPITLACGKAEFAIAERPVLT
jgi:hypothetical protein